MQLKFPMPCTQSSLNKSHSFFLMAQGAWQCSLTPVRSRDISRATAEAKAFLFSSLRVPPTHPCPFRACLHSREAAQGIQPLEPYVSLSAGPGAVLWPRAIFLSNHDDDDEEEDEDKEELNSIPREGEI